MTDEPFGALRQQLSDAATAFSDSPHSVADILSGIVDDVDQMLREELEIFPVCHHSPASGLAMARRLRDKQPKVIYLELSEDLHPLLNELRHCRLPVALQAFATELDGFPEGAGPLSMIAPITESSAEYQAISYALDTPGVELVLVDKSIDHFFQALPKPAEKPDASTDIGDEAALHGDAVGVEIGDLRPRFAELEEHLLHHGKVRHWSEWWDQYVEQPLVGADYDTYRQVMTLIGSLFRRLTPTGGHRMSSDEDRERHMWTRIREHLAASGADPATCIHICGAFHAASRVEQFGLNPADAQFEIAPPTRTKWLYGLIPSSYSAIEAQFGLAPGSVSIASATWGKAVKESGVKPFQLKGQKQAGKAAGRAKKAAAAAVVPITEQLSGFLSTPPKAGDLDEAELLGWCVDIVRLARKNGYLSSTADAIAIFETSILLAGMRNRSRPTPYDFQDAAVTCIEKDSVPGRRDVARLCEILLGGDRIGQVGYESLPPLARDVFDRLRPLGVDLTKRNVQRVLMDLSANPELKPCSRLLWMLRYLLPNRSVRSIMGACELDERSIQESWDVDIGRNQRGIIELGYDGVTVEQVFEQRLRRAVWAPNATAASALAAVEDSILYLDSRRFTEELGARAVELLSTERTVDGAPEVLKRIRRLMAYYRANEPELPQWCESFVAQGYAHYCTLLPSAFVDEETGVRQVAAMLGFLFTMESVALAVGCDRAQLELAVAQSHPETLAKVSLRWAAQFRLGTLSLDDLRARCEDLLANPLAIPGFPLYLSGFVQGLDSIPALTPFVVEVISKAFARLPDSVLLPWLPSLVTTFKEEARELVPVLIREAGRTFPAKLGAVDTWVPPWSAPAKKPAKAVVSGGLVAELLAGHPQSCNALGELLGCEPEWRQPDQSGGVSASPEAVALLAAHPQSAEALAELVNG